MNSEVIAKTYLSAVERGDLSTILDLFTTDGKVYSPLYGPILAKDFYPALFKDTGRAKIGLKGLTEGKQVNGDPLITIWFQFDWTLLSGELANFECVDVLKIDENECVYSLHIIYDTVFTRPAYEKEYGVGSSWRPTFKPLE